MEQYEFIRNIERRSFLKILSFTGVAGLVYPKQMISKLLDDNPRILNDNAQVIVVEDENATNGLSIDEEVIQIMVDSGIKEMTQMADLGEAWKSLLPGISADSIIAIKVNCINSSVPTHQEVTYSVARTLTLMNFDGEMYSENNIIIFDRTTGELRNGKYTINTSALGFRCFGTDGNYSSDEYDIAGKQQKISKIMTETADYLINIAVLKNHSGAGFTLCMKNHYGTCNRPGSIHLYGKYNDPYIGALNAIEPIKSKQKVNIIDALFGVRQGGPGGQPQFTPNKIFFSTDVVAIDYLGVELLKENGSKTVSAPTSLDTAANEYGLGISDPDKIDVIDILNPSNNVSVKDNSSSNGIILNQNSPNPVKTITNIKFYLPRQSNIDLSVFDINGKLIKNIVNNTLDAGLHQLEWNVKDSSGFRVPNGNYICMLSTSSYKKSIIMVVNN